MLSVIGIAGHPADAFAQEAPVPVPAPVPATAAHVAHQQAVESATAAVDQLDDSALQIPVAKLDFKPQQAAIPGANGSMAFSSPIVCSPSGIPFVTFIEPSDFGPQTIYSLDPKGGHAFSVKEVPGLYDTNFIHGYFVSDSVVGILVNGTKDSKVAPNTVSIGPKLPPKHIYTGEHHDYLVEFDISGNYKTTRSFPNGINSGGWLRFRTTRFSRSHTILLIWCQCCSCSTQGATSSEPFRFRRRWLPAPKS
jgi:hypothetical protein